MSSGTILHLDDPHVGIKANLACEAFFNFLLRDRLIAETTCEGDGAHLDGR